MSSFAPFESMPRNLNWRLVYVAVSFHDRPSFLSLWAADEKSARLSRSAGLLRYCARISTRELGFCTTL